jgi:subtilisin family serine protease
MGANGTGSSSEVAMGILWAADHGADVINLSLGGTANSTAIDSAVQYAVSKDCVVVAAAGNEGSNAVYYPAADANVIGVGATDGHDARSTYSNYGPRVDITAPGDSVYSTIRVLHGSYGYLSGTSMATPHVAGVVALIRAKNPTWARQQVEEQLLSTALDLGAPGRDDSFGYGRVRADLAVGDTVPGGAITGTVSHGGGSLAGVSVSVPDHAPVLTAADGSYTVSGIVPSTYNVTYAKAGYSGQTVRATVLPSATTTQDVSLEIAVAVQSPTPKPVALSTPKVSGLASAHRGTTLKGTLIPAHSKRLTVQVRRLVNHRWRAYGSTTVASDKTGSWHVRLRLRRATYSVRVVSAADAVYSAGASSWRTVRVR